MFTEVSASIKSAEKLPWIGSVKVMMKLFRTLETRVQMQVKSIQGGEFKSVVVENCQFFANGSLYTGNFFPMV